MVDKICDKLMDKVHAKMPEVDEERAEVIRYGFELIIGEVPKFILMVILAIMCGVFKYFIISTLIIGVYRFFSGGLHLRTHIGCFLTTTITYFGNIYISNSIEFENEIVKYIVAVLIYIFAVSMIYLYAPADTDSVPILRKDERKKKKIWSIAIVSIWICISIIINDRVVSNMFLIGVFLQTITITKASYKLFNVKLGYLEYIKSL